MVVNPKSMNLNPWKDKCVAPSCGAILSKPIRKRNNTSAMIHSRRPKQNGGR